MNVVYVGAFRLPNLDAAAPRVLNNAKALRAVGCDVTFISWGGEYNEEDICSDGGYRTSGFRYFISRDIISGGDFFERLNAKFNRGSKSFEILKTLQNPDLIILYNSNYFFTRKMLAYCKINSIKLANDITEWYDSNELHFTDLIPNFLNMYLTQFRVRNKIVISSYLNNYFSNSNNIIVPPLCDQHEEKWNKIVDDNRVNDFDGATLIYAGSPAKKDCVHTVINVVNTLVLEGFKFRFLILGISREQYLKHYSHLLNHKTLHENIIFLGRVSQDLIPAYYRIADFMVLLREPTRKNMAGFPTKFAESISAGIPVITNSTSDLARYVVSGQSGFMVKSHNYEDLLFVLRNQVSKLQHSDIENMKRSVSTMKHQFDWRFYVDAFNQFVLNLK